MYKSILTKLTGSLSALALGLFMTGPANAADLLDQPTQWSGFYVGGFAAANGGEATDGSSSFDFDGYESEGGIGIQAGFNFDQGDFVWGIEADAGTGLEHGARGRHRLGPIGLVTVRGRLGVKVDEFLFYGTAGLGILFNEAKSSSEDADQQTSDTGFRPVVGAGLETFISEHISLKAEMLAFIGDETLPYEGNSGDDAGKLQNIYTTRVGMNFHLNPGYVQAADRMDHSSRWNGSYFGGFGGANLGEATDGTSSFDFSGHETVAAGGVQAGFNFEQGDYVWGIEADAGTGIEHKGGSGHEIAARGLITVRGRLGVLVDDYLVYGTAGLGILFNEAVSSEGGTSQSTRETSLRPVIGGGIETFVAERVSVKAEALAFIGDETLPYETDSSPDTANIANVYAARIGVNFHFD